MYYEMRKTLFQNYFSFLKHLHDFYQKNQPNPISGKGKDQILSSAYLRATPSPLWNGYSAKHLKRGMCVFIYVLNL